MDKLTIEQKAKAYDLALEKAKELIETSAAYDKFTIEKIFPELKESNEEEVRKAMIEFFKHEREEGVTVLHYGVNIERMIAWLEKQGGQKPADKVEPKFHEGDWVVSPNGVYWHIDRIENNRYEVTSNTGESSNWNLDTNIYHRFTIQDAKNGDVLADGVGVILFKSIGDNNVINFHAYFSGLFAVQEGEHYWGHVRECTLSPATKEQRERFFAAMHDAGFEWDAEKRELRKVEPFDKYEGLTDFERTLADICIGWIGEEIGWKQYIKDNADVLLKIAIKKFNSVQDVPFEQKPAWSEEDEKMRKKALLVISDDCGVSDYEEISAWLKSLKDRVQPQPKQEENKGNLGGISSNWSEEDALRLEEVICMIEANGRWVRSDDAVKSVLDWLKSLEDRYTWKPSGEQMEALDFAANCIVPAEFCVKRKVLKELLEQLKKL